MTPTPRRRRRRAARSVPALVLTATVALTGCSFGGGGADDVGEPSRPSAAASPTTSDPAADPALNRFYGQRPAWGACGELQCARVNVPLDWSAPGGETIQLAVARRRAGGDAVGSLFINPGGPGVSGVDYLRAAAGTYGAAVREAYDLVSWDPRGVGESAAVRCLPNERLDAFFAAEGSPDDAAEVRELQEANREFAEACRRNTGPLLRHVDTLSTVRDMDVLRAVVGDEVFSYFGASYGTFLGAWYAERFPWRVGRMVLDGAVDPSLNSAGYTEGQALGFSRAVRGFVEQCLRTERCPLRGSVEDAYDQIEALLRRTDSAPLRTAGGRELTQSLLSIGLAQGMYDPRFWPSVTRGLTEAFQGEGTTLLQLSDLYLHRDEQGRYDPDVQASGPLFCIDHDEDRSVEQIATSARDIARKYPPLGDVLGWGALGCAVWPVEAVVPAQRLTAPGAAPILVVGTTEDPATPYEWSQALASQLSSGVLLTRTGQGHTGYKSGSRCIDAAVDRYLVTGTAPRDGTTCSTG